jgi:hypothetical protein
MKNPNVQIGVSGGPCSLGKPGSTAALGVSINRKLWPAVLLVSLLLCLHAGKTRAQSFDVGWFSIDGGGGVSSGGEFSISGIVGQPDAGIMTGGEFALEGGFWGVILDVQTPGSPPLNITLTPTNTVVLTWPAASTGFALQQNTDLSTVNWQPVTNAVSVVGDMNQVIIDSPPGNDFFRLVQQ